MVFSSLTWRFVLFLMHCSLISNDENYRLTQSAWGNLAVNTQRKWSQLFPLCYPEQHVRVTTGDWNARASAVQRLAHSTGWSSEAPKSVLNSFCLMHLGIKRVTEGRKDRTEPDIQHPPKTCLAVQKRLDGSKFRTARRALWSHYLFTVYLSQPSNILLTFI